MDTTIKTRKDAIARIAEAAAAEGIMLVFLRSGLERLFGKEAVTFSFFPLTHFRINSPDGGEDIVIASTKFALEPTEVVGRIAIDCTLAESEHESPDGLGQAG